MKRDLAPMLFKDDDPQPRPPSALPVAKANVSPAARRKALDRRTKDGQPVHSFRSLLGPRQPDPEQRPLRRRAPTTILSRPTPTQTRAFQLLGLKIAA